MRRTRSIIHPVHDLIGGLLDADMFPEVGVKWEHEFLRTIQSLGLNHTQANALVSNSLKLQMIEVMLKITFRILTYVNMHQQCNDNYQ